MRPSSSALANAKLTASCLCLAIMTMPASYAESEAAPLQDEDISTICIEARSGMILFEHNADVVRAPASMVKMMQMLLVTEGLRAGAWTLDRQIVISKHTQSIGGSQMALEEGEVFSVGELMQAVAVGSANDGAMAIAEGLWGSEAAYLKRTNKRAAELGMTDTVFRSVHGLPPDEGELHDATTARDMALLAQYCAAEPRIIKWSSQTEVRIRPDDAAKASTNKLLGRVPGLDGLKTGFTRAAGFCVTATAQRGGIRLIAVVMGVEKGSVRFDIAERLIEDGFAAVCRKRVIAKGQAIKPAVPVANCKTASVRLTAAEDVWVTVKKSDQYRLEVRSDRPWLIQAPVAAGTLVGKVHVHLTDTTLGSAPLVVPNTLEEAGWRWKLINSIRRRN